MRWSQLFIPTLKEDPASAETDSHRLLMRAGYIRPLGAGLYSLLPIAQKVRQKIIAIIKEELDAIGGQEFVLPALHPAEIWEESGRLATMGEIMFRLKDRKGTDMVLGVTHEEIFTSIARNALQSYRQLPQTWYQFQTKFRDELRPKAGLLRVREFTMKDSYSFDLDANGLDKSFLLHKEAYERIFTRVGLSFVGVEASSGAMGGSASTEFMVLTDAGEDLVVLCKACGYAANTEKATSKISIASKDESAAQTLETIEKFATPDLKTVDELAKFAPFAAANNQIKTLVYVAESKLILVLVRGDHDLNLTKLTDLLAVSEARPAEAQEIFEAMGAHAGSLGGVKVSKDNTGKPNKIQKIIADKALAGRINMVTGANEDDFHWRGVSLERDIEIDEWADVRTVKTGEGCTTCGEALSVDKALEIGHIFKLGTRYSQKMGATVLNSAGETVPIVMGSYGIGVERLMAAVVERSHDTKGIIWPLSIAPYTVVITVINVANEDAMKAANSIYKQFKDANIDVLLDDRDERPGIKFADSELIGIPIRINIGKKLVDGLVEVVDRSTKSSTDIRAEEAFLYVRDKLSSATLTHAL
ncbi:MAG: proline--tRNA ligase [Leptolyngbya sp.]|nr:proline--tRNA ligase [Candidatus Melainabacteria bacterium]